MNPQDDGLEPQGQPDASSTDYSDAGDQSNDEASQGDPANQNGQATDQGNADLAKYKEEVRRLNRALIEARRGNRQPLQNGQPQGQQQGQPTFDTPEGQYAISLQLATADLSRKLEDIYELYPEIPVSEVARIRKNPWAFASQDSYMSGDVPTAMLEIETALSQRAEELAKSGSGVQTAQQQQVRPAAINPNQPTERAGDAAPGSAEDVNPWTMPMNELEKKAKKLHAQNLAKS